MKEIDNFRSEKLTVHLRHSIYVALLHKISHNDEKTKLTQEIQNVFQDIFNKEYFICENDAKFFEKHKNLLEYTYFYISPKDLDIEIVEDRLKEIDFRVCIHIPIISKNQLGRDKDQTEEKELLQKLLRKYNIFGSFKSIYQKYMELVIKDETYCDKYFSRTKRKWRPSDDFCIDCTTTSQLKSRYPEVYRVYFEMKTGKNSKEIAIENLRKKLGFI